MKAADVSMRFRPADAKSVDTIINSLNCHKSPGIDGIRAVDFKRVAARINSVIVNLINQSIINRKFPSTLKAGIIRPISKKGSRARYENYRPITIVPVINKIAEKYISKEIYEFFIKNGIISNSQAFNLIRIRHSCCLDLQIAFIRASTRGSMLWLSL